MTTQSKDRYEVHTFTLCQGWINCWSVTDHNNIEFPDSFSSINAAQAEIDELISDAQLEIEAGLRQADEGYDCEDYRIYDNVKNEYIA